MSIPGENRSLLVSGEAVQIDLRVARLGSRIIAAVIDFVVQFLAMAFLFAFIVNLIHPGTAALRACVVLIVVLIFIGYPVIMEVAWGGRTLGKAAMGLRAARDDGGPLRFRHALVRGLLGAFIEKPPIGFVLGFIPVLCSLSSRQGKRLGDLLAGTVVLQVRFPASGAYVPPMPPPLAGWATTLDLSRFDDGLALQSRQFLGRAGQLTDEARERLGASLLASVQAVVAPLPPPGTPGWAYVSAVLAERRRREELRLYTAHPLAPPNWQPPPPAPRLQPEAAGPPPPAPGPFTLPG